MLNIFELLMRRQDKILVKKESDKTSKSKAFKVFTVVENLRSYGFSLDKDLMEKLFFYSESEICNFYNDVVFCIEKMTGGDKKYNPMYPNFPKQVMDMSRLELLVNAQYHYFHSFLKDIGFDFGSGLKEYEKETRDDDDYEYQLKKLSIGTEKDLLIIFENLLSSKVSLSSQDYEDIICLLKYFIENKIDYNIPSNISNKEVLANLFSYMINDNIDFNYNKYFDNPIDVLRICAVMSGYKADLSCFEDICFSNFKRRQRKLFLSVLNNVCSDFKKAIEISKRYRALFVILGEKLHPGEKKYKKLYPNAFNFFYHLRNKIKVHTDIEYIEENIKNGKITDKLMILLSKKPSVFARKLDKLLRICSSDKKRIEVIDVFSKCIESLEVSFIIQLYNYFRDRNDIIDIGRKAYIPKSSLKNTIRVFDFKEEKFSSEINSCILNVLVNEIKKKLGRRGNLGKVFLDEELKNYKMPFSLRSASSNYKQLIKGSKVKIDDNLNNVRFFVWWKDNDDQRIDIDLSLSFVKEDDYDTSTVSYVELKDERINAVHSGDVTSAPSGASEFVDVDIEKSLSEGYRYCVMSIVCFNDIKLSDVKDCLCGWMELKDTERGEIYNIKAVKNKFVINSSSKSVIPCMIDLKEKRLIWVDSNFLDNKGFVTMECQEDEVKQFIETFNNLSKPTLYDLFMFHVFARGELVKNKSDADKIFSVDEDSFVSVFDNSIILGEYM